MKNCDSHLTLKQSGKFIITQKTPKRAQILSKICPKNKKHSHNFYEKSTKLKKFETHPGSLWKNNFSSTALHSVAQHFARNGRILGRKLQKNSWNVFNCQITRADGRLYRVYTVPKINQKPSCDASYFLMTNLAIPPIVTRRLKVETYSGNICHHQWRS